MFAAGSESEETKVARLATQVMIQRWWQGRAAFKLLLKCSDSPTIKLSREETLATTNTQIIFK